jgi:hypothetical protein
MDIKTLHNQINTTLYNRNVPSHNLQPYLDVRPVPTKYVVLPTGDQRTTSQLIQQPTYFTGSTFNPGDAAPWSGFNVNLETDMRLKGFRPDSKSDLFKFNFKPNTIATNPHPLLSKEERFSGRFLEKEKDSLLFHNATRERVEME